MHAWYRGIAHSRVCAFAGSWVCACMGSRVHGITHLPRHGFTIPRYLALPLLRLSLLPRLAKLTLMGLSPGPLWMHTSHALCRCNGLQFRFDRGTGKPLEECHHAA